MKNFYPRNSPEKAESFQWEKLDKLRDKLKNPTAREEKKPLRSAVYQENPAGC